MMSRVAAALELRAAVVLGAAVTLIATAVPAHAAPTMDLTNLPVSGALREALKTERGMTPEQIDEFIATLARIDVYDDHTNPADEYRNDPRFAKTYWGAPYFTPSQARSVVGAEQFADYALEILDEADQLLSSFEFQALEYLRLTRRRQALIKKLDDIDRALQGTLDEAARASLEQLRPNVVGELAAVERDIQALVNGGAEGAGSISVELRQSIANSIVLQLSRIGVTPTSQEQTKLDSDNPQEWVTGLGSLRARASEGQFGLRQVIMESGYTDQQQQVLRTYLELRPDVTARGLAVNRVYARPIAQTLIDQQSGYITRPGVVQLRGVNLGTQGACGGIRSCNVVIEYTNVGARSVRFQGGPTDVTPALVPVMFEADVNVALPDFVGSVECHFKTGWTAEGRADVKDGAIIYDGDLTNKIKYDSIDEEFGGCKFDIQEGSRDSAFFHILMDMDRYYRDLHTERQQAAKQEKDAYRRSIEAELQWHQQNSQRRDRGGWFSDVFGMITGGSILQGIGAWLIGETRGFYWHTTILDTHSIDEIHVRQNYSIRNLSARERYAFDGFPLVCWTPSGPSSVQKVMKACPDAEFGNADTEVDIGEEACADTDIFGECRDEASGGT